MKHKKTIDQIVLVIVIFILSIASIKAQAPTSFKYQAVLRDASGGIIANQSKTIKLDILQGGVSGVVVFTESHDVTTTSQGLINLNIGSINTTGLSSIDWASNTYFIRISVGNNEIGTSQLLSVPYALYAAKSGNGFSGNFSDLKNKPNTLSGYGITDKFSTVAASGDYSDLKNAPNLKDTVSKYGFSGDYKDLKNKPIGSNLGDIQYWDGNTWSSISAGKVGQVLTMGADGRPQWISISLPAPVVLTASASQIQANSVRLDGLLNANGSATSAYFEYGKTTAYGQSINIPNVFLGNESSTVMCNITGLEANTTYHYRMQATNAGGVNTGIDKTFSTTNPSDGLSYGSVSDIDGNTYKTIAIGEQTWMAENLKVTKFNDGTNIPLFTVGLATTSPVYSWYYNDEATYKSTYGALYNGIVIDKIINGNKNICPVNWHIPTQDEWLSMINYLGGSSVAGDKLKEIGATHWNSTNTGANNSTGFNALPSGEMHYDGMSMGLGIVAKWWSQTLPTTSNAYCVGIGVTNSPSDIWTGGEEIHESVSIRCIKD